MKAVACKCSFLGDFVRGSLSGAKLLYRRGHHQILMGWRLDFALQGEYEGAVGKDNMVSKL